MAEAPKRAFWLKIIAGGDTMADLKSLLRELLEDVDLDVRSQNQPLGPRAIGGYSRGGAVDFVHDPEQTHDRYFEQLDAYKKERDANG